MNHEMWEKTSIVVQSTKEDGTERKRNFNNIAQETTDEQLVNFGKLVAQLTGEDTDQLLVNVTTAMN